GGWHATARGRDPGLTGGGLHGAVDEPVAGGGIHSHPDDGRHRRPVVPRVLGHTFRGGAAVAAGVAHYHSDDVLTADPSSRARAGRKALPRERTRFRGRARCVPSLAALGTRKPWPGDVSARDDRGIQYLPLHRDPQGVLPAAGYRAADRRYSGRPGDLLPVD